MTRGVCDGRGSLRTGSGGRGPGDGGPRSATISTASYGHAGKIDGQEWCPGAVRRGRRMTASLSAQAGVLASPPSVPRTHKRPAALTGGGSSCRASSPDPAARVSGTRAAVLIACEEADRAHTGLSLRGRKGRRRRHRVVVRAGTEVALDATRRHGRCRPAGEAGSDGQTQGDGDDAGALHDPSRLLLTATPSRLPGRSVLSEQGERPAGRSHRWLPRRVRWP